MAAHSRRMWATPRRGWRWEGRRTTTAVRPTVVPSGASGAYVVVSMARIIAPALRYDVRSTFDGYSPRWPLEGGALAGPPLRGRGVRLRARLSRPRGRRQPRVPGPGPRVGGRAGSAGRQRPPVAVPAAAVPARARRHHPALRRGPPRIHSDERRVPRARGARGAAHAAAPGPRGCRRGGGRDPLVSTAADLGRAGPPGDVALVADRGRVRAGRARGGGTVHRAQPRRRRRPRPGRAGEADGPARGRRPGSDHRSHGTALVDPRGRARARVRARARPVDGSQPARARTPRDHDGKR